jgi:predicted nucleic acid-binding protein
VNVLVDTTIWSFALRRKSQDLGLTEKASVTELAELIKEGRSRIIGLIRQELLSGIKTSEQYENLRRILRAFPDEAIETGDYEAAAKASNNCRSQGIAVSVSDMLICVVAMSRKWSIFTSDPDFQIYANILPIKLHKPRK